jgi:hypothetical protein
MKARIIATLGLVVLSASAPAQSVDQIVKSARDAAVRRAQGINNYLVVEVVGTVETTQYYEKQVVDGFPVFVSRQVGQLGVMGGIPGRTGGAGNSETARRSANVFTSDQFARAAKLDGVEDIDGSRSYKLVIDDVASVPAINEMSGTGPVKAKRVTIWLDVAQYVPRKMEMLADLTMNGATREITVSMLLQDYRTVEGVLHPFKTVVKNEGLQDAITPEQRRQMAEARARIAALPDAQRAIAERMIPNLDALGDEGIVTTVKSLKANTPPPGI